jgi:folate-binding protein YgfZ
MTDTYFAQLPSRALVAVTGDGWRAFLQGLITNDVEDLAVGGMRFAALLTPQGKFLFDIFVIARDGGCLLDVQAAQRDALVQRLTMYRLRAKVGIEPVAGAVFALFPPRLPQSEEWIADPRLADLGWRGIDAAPPPTAVLADEAAHDAHRLSLGVPDPARDCVPDRTYPLEADFDLLNGVDFRKGCFIGQETTSRMKRRAAIKNRMLPIAFEGSAPAFGAEVMAGELRAGEVLSGGEGRAMALLRLDRIKGAALSVDGRAVRAVAPDWLADHLHSDSLRSSI